jgi:hypothetical protein
LKNAWDRDSLKQAELSSGVRVSVLTWLAEARSLPEREVIMGNSMSSAKSPLDPFVRELLLELHGAMMRLHKILLDEERLAYEQANGPMGGAGQVLDLVMSDPWFDWLHGISRLIVRIDEVTEDRDDVTETEAMVDARRVIENARTLFGSGDTEFRRRYKKILVRSSAAVAAHFEVQRLLVAAV